MSEQENNVTVPESSESIEERIYDLNITDDHIALFRDTNPDEKIKSAISSHLSKIANQYGLEKYKIIFLYDDDNSISYYHSNKIYHAVKDVKKQKNILMVLHSTGGQIEPAYLISKTCKRLSKEKFIVSIPRRAKSAATLISLGANELHMGLLSELGPIDPQFGGFPALGLSNAIEKIAEMSEKYPNASDMFAKYLTANVNIRHLGLFERVNESAVQYAERLLIGKVLPNEQTPNALANHFTNHYKDHNFVIDTDEAASLLGKQMVKENTKEYEFGNKIYDFFGFTSFLFEIFKSKNMRYVGSIDDGLDFYEKKKE